MRRSVSVVVPVLNEARQLPDLLDQLERQAPPPDGFEVLVVDGGSTDRTRQVVEEKARSWPRVKLLANPGRRSSAGRNVGARAARGEFVLFLDGHCSLPSSRYVQRLVELFEDSQASCLARPQPLDGASQGGWARAIALARHSPLGHKPGSEIYGAAPGYVDPHSAGAAYRREVLEALRGYDERFDACEDVEFNHRVKAAGFRAYTHPDLAVSYTARSTLGAFLRQMFRYGRGRARLMARHPGTAPVTLLALTAALVIGFAALPWLGWSRGLLAAALIALLAAVVYLVEGFRQSGDPARAWRVAVALALIPIGLEAGFLRGLLEVLEFRRPPRLEEACAG